MKTIATPDGTPGVRILPPFLFGGTLLVGFGLQWMWPVRIAPERFLVLLRVEGGALILIAIVLAMAAHQRFERAGTNVNPLRPVTALVLSGPYRFTRNPMYLGFVLLTVGIALIANALWPIVVLIPTLFVLHYEVIAKEERLLEARFGDEYRAYRRRVRRWI